MARFLSKEKPIPQKKYDDIPFREWPKRDAAHEEACRDLDKSPEQLLVDIHDESLDRERPPHETIARSIARLASLQLRTQRSINWMTFVLVILTIILTVQGFILICRSSP